MHIVSVIDPWFGEYLLLSTERMDEYEEPEYKCYLGPLFTRALRVESLNNRGKTKQYAGLTEKSCTHSWVSGTVAATPPDLVNTIHELWTSLITYEYPFTSSSEVIVDGVHYTTKRDGKWKFELTEDEHSAVLRIGLFDTSTLTAGDAAPYTWIHVCVTGILTLDRVVDELTGSVRYYNPRLSSPFVLNPSKSRSYKMTCCSVTSPFGSGDQDNLGAYLGQIRSLAQAADAGTRAKEGSMTKRDEAIYNALDSLSIADLNPIEEIQTLLAPLQPLMQLHKLIKSSTSLISIIKNLASLHLFYKYVVKCGILSAKGWQQMIAALSHPQHLLSKLKGKGLIGRGRSYENVTIGEYPATVVYNAKLCYTADFSGIDNILDLLNILGLTPRIADLWDIVPYSFCVDWVLPIGDAINNLELNNIQQRIPFNYGVISRKITTTVEKTFTVNSHEYRVRLKVCSYTRQVIDQFPSDVWFGISFHDPRKQLLTGGALLIQYLLGK